MIYSFSAASVEEHLRHIREVFVRLRKADLKLSKRKCCFLKAHVQYLGHYISGTGLEPVPEKLDSLKQMPAPTDVTGIQEVSGICGVLQEVHPALLRHSAPTNEFNPKR